MSAKAKALILALSMSAFSASCEPATSVDRDPIVGTPGGNTGGSTPGGAAGGATPSGMAGGNSAGGTTAGAAMTGGGATGGARPDAGASPGGGATGGNAGGTTGGAQLDAGAASDGGAQDAGSPLDASPADAQVDAASGDAGSDAGGIALVGCSPVGATQNCGTFTTAMGATITLGPAGASIDPNVGKGFENAIASGDSDNNFSCNLFAATFGQDPEVTKRSLDITGLKMDLYTVYRPTNWPAEQKLPIISWGNGTCAKPEGYGALLRYIASHGFFVVAPNSRWVGSGSAQRKAIDFALAANKDPQSPYYQRLDPTKIAAAGHSQGAGGTEAASSDSRILNVILFNGGGSPNKPFLTVSGERDLGSPTVATMQRRVDAGTKAAFLYYHMIPGNGGSDGHLTLMTQPERVTGASVAWFKYLLSADPESKDWFVGTSCKLCNQTASYHVGQKGL